MLSLAWRQFQQVLVFLYQYDLLYICRVWVKNVISYEQKQYTVKNDTATVLSFRVLRVITFSYFIGEKLILLKALGQGDEMLLHIIWY